MPRPKITLENYEAVYDHYEQIYPVIPVTKLVHGLFGFVYRPRTVFSANSRDMTEEHFAKGGLMIMAPNHTKIADPLVLASLAKRYSSLQPFMQRVVISGKAPIFAHPLMTPTRPIVDNFGGRYQPSAPRT